MLHFEYGNTEYGLKKRSPSKEKYPYEAEQNDV